MQKSLSQIILGAFQWILAIAAVLGTLGLFTWLAVLFFRKDPHTIRKENEQSRNRP
jgi:hypothetical protein